MWSQQKQRRKENVFGSGCYDSMTLDGAHHLKLQQSASFTNAECIIFCRLPRQKCICMTLMHAQKVCETVTRILIFAYTNLKRIVDHTVPPHLKNGPELEDSIPCDQSPIMTCHPTHSWRQLPVQPFSETDGMTLNGQ